MRYSLRFRIRMVRRYIGTDPDRAYEWAIGIHQPRARARVLRVIGER